MNSRRVPGGARARGVIKAPTWHHAGAFMRTVRSSALQAAVRVEPRLQHDGGNRGARPAVRDHPLRTNRLVKLISHITRGTGKRTRS